MFYFSVAFKFSKKKVADETLKLLHGVLFARRGKVRYFHLMNVGIFMFSSDPVK